MLLAHGLVLLTLGIILTPVIHACARGRHNTGCRCINCATGPSWFDVLATTPHPTNRAARRAR